MAKRKHSKHISTRMSADRVKEIIRTHVEPGVQAKCKLAIFRNKVYPLTGISERTFWRYLNEIETKDAPDLTPGPSPCGEGRSDPNQLKLF